MLSTSKWTWNTKNIGNHFLRRKRGFSMSMLVDLGAVQGFIGLLYLWSSDDLRCFSNILGGDFSHWSNGSSQFPCDFTRFLWSYSVFHHIFKQIFFSIPLLVVRGRCTRDRAQHRSHAAEDGKRVAEICSGRNMSWNHRRFVGSLDWFCWGKS